MSPCARFSAPLSRRRPALVASVLVLGLCAALAPGLSTQAADAATTVPVLGYVEEDGSPDLITGSASGLASVGVDGVNITSSGDPGGAPDGTAYAHLARAHALGKPAVLLVGNFVGDDFSEAAAYRLLSSRTKIDVLVRSLVSEVSAHGWDGVQVDIESLTSRDAAGLVNLLGALKAALPTGRSVGLAVMLLETTAEYADAGYLLDQIGAVVDRVVLMAYDQHGGDPESGAGPIGALGWQTRGLEALLDRAGGHGVPAGKVDLGVAGYGARWSRSGTQLAAQVPDATARSSAGSAARYDDTAKEWTAKLSNGQVLWWSDARSLADRKPLVDRYGLHGLAVWSLNVCDPIRA